MSVGIVLRIWEVRVIPLMMSDPVTLGEGCTFPPFPLLLGGLGGGESSNKLVSSPAAMEGHASARAMVVTRGISPLYSDTL